MNALLEHPVDLDRVREPQENPAGLPVRGEADLTGDNESLSADPLTHDGPLAGDLARQVADPLLREHRDRIRVGHVPRLGFENERVLADLRDVRLVEVRALDRGVDRSAAEFEVSAHGSHATERHTAFAVAVAS